MRVTWLGWAGIEVVHGDARILIDPLINPAAVYAAAADRAAGVELPALAEPGDDPAATLVLLTHLHRDHADAEAVSRWADPGAQILGPRSVPAAGPFDDAGIAAARAEFAAAGLQIIEVVEWERREIGPFTVIALPAADGTGESQVSWAITAGEQRILHCGDTMFHGWWWRLASTAGPFDAAFLPINGAVVNFPWRQPPSPYPAAMTAEDAVIAGRLLGAGVTVPTHFGGFDFEPYYRSARDALARFVSAADREGVPVRPFGHGETVEVSALAGPEVTGVTSGDHGGGS
jgi:L-ascorbate metabolism protein UlaG (beta-lactamase superfamily)